MPNAKDRCRRRNDGEAHRDITSINRNSSQQPFLRRKRRPTGEVYSFLSFFPAMCLSCSMDLALLRRQGGPPFYHQSLELGFRVRFSSSLLKSLFFIWISYSLYLSFLSISRMPEPDQGTSTAPSSSSAIRRESSGNATSSSSSSQVRVAEDYRDRHQLRNPELEPQQIGMSNRRNTNTLAFDDAATVIGDDAWSCIIVLLTFWFFGLSFFLLLVVPLIYSLFEFCTPKTRYLNFILRIW